MILPSPTPLYTFTTKQGNIRGLAISFAPLSTTLNVQNNDDGTLSRVRLRKFSPFLSAAASGTGPLESRGSNMCCAVKHCTLEPTNEPNQKKKKHKISGSIDSATRCCVRTRRGYLPVFCLYWCLSTLGGLETRASSFRSVFR